MDGQEVRRLLLCYSPTLPGLNGFFSVIKRLARVETTDIAAFVSAEAEIPGERLELIRTFDVDQEAEL